MITTSRILTVSAGVLMTAMVIYFSVRPDTAPRFSAEEKSSEVVLAPLRLKAMLPLDIRVLEKEGSVTLDRHCHDRDEPYERCLFRYAPPFASVSLRTGAPTADELSQLGTREGFEVGRLEANEGDTEIVYERLDRDSIESIAGFVRVDGRWFDFACKHEVYDGGSHAYGFCMRSLVALEGISGR